MGDLLTEADRTTRTSPFRVLVGLSLLLLTAGGFAARAWISQNSLGSNDWEAWQHFGFWIGKRGLLEMYQADPRLNHPPLAALWSMWAKRIAGATGWSFPAVFRLPVIAADLLACVVLALLWKRRSGWLTGLGAAALYAWSPAAVLVGAYHCNTDNIAIALALLAAYLIAERRSFLSAGLALGAAINVKLIPVILIPPLLGLCRDWRDVRRLIGGLAVAALPFLPVLVGAGAAFYRNALSYNPMADRWGICFLLEATQYWRYPDWWRGWEDFASDNFDWYHAHARNFILLASAGLGLLAWLLGRYRRGVGVPWTAYHLSAMTMASFLALTGGFGVQYVVYAAPVLLAANLWSGFFYNLWAGAFLFVIYAHWWTGTRPFYSGFGGPAYFPAPLLGLIAWWILIEFVFRSLFLGMRNTRGQSPTRPSVSTLDV